MFLGRVRTSERKRHRRFASISVAVITLTVVAVVGVQAAGDEYDASIAEAVSPRMSAQDVASLARADLDMQARHTDRSAPVDILSITAIRSNEIGRYIPGERPGPDRDGSISWLVYAKGTFVMLYGPPEVIGATGSVGWVEIDDATGQVIRTAFHRDN